MINFCTLFDSNYSAKGLAMYESLVRCCPSFHLYVFAFDDKLVRVFDKLKLENVTVITLQEFEDEELLAVKPTRTAGEYCWTCSSSTILYCLEHFDIESCTYIDADLYFFADPSVLIDEMGNDDVLITEHRYTPKYDQTKTSGKYCVQFMTFKNNPNGLKILQWWRKACLEWCYCRFEDGKFGDQKYLDDWTSRFDGVHELQHLGGGVAPWNMQQYEFKCQEGKIIGVDIKTKIEFPVIFFHFHGLQCYSIGLLKEFVLSHLVYDLPPSIRKYVYDIYLPKLRSYYRQIKKVDSSVNGLSIKKKAINIDSNVVALCKSIINYFQSLNYYSYWIEF